eukprot:4294031-Prymnesium_polylepis.1
MRAERHHILQQRRLISRRHLCNPAQRQLQVGTDRGGALGQDRRRVQREQADEACPNPIRQPARRCARTEAAGRQHALEKLPAGLERGFAAGAHLLLLCLCDAAGQCHNLLPWRAHPLVEPHRPVCASLPPRPLPCAGRHHARRHHLGGKQHRLALGGGKRTESFPSFHVAWPGAADSSVRAPPVLVAVLLAAVHYEGAMLTRDGFGHLGACAARTRRDVSAENAHAFEHVSRRAALATAEAADESHFLVGGKLD